MRLCTVRHPTVGSFTVFVSGDDGAFPQPAQRRKAEALHSAATGAAYFLDAGIRGLIAKNPPLRFVKPRIGVMSKANRPNKLCIQTFRERFPFDRFEVLHSALR